MKATARRIGWLMATLALAACSAPNTQQTQCSGRRVNAVGDDAIGIASDGTYAFVGFTTTPTEADPEGRIYRVPLAGGDQVEVTKVVELTALVADASGLYYLKLDNTGPFELRHYDAVSGANRLVGSVYSRATTMALDADNVYVAAFSGNDGVVEVFRIPKSLNDGMPSQYELVAKTTAKGEPRDLVITPTAALWSADALSQSATDGRLWTVSLTAPAEPQLVGEGLGTVQAGGLAAIGSAGYALVRDPDASVKVWQFTLGDTNPTVVSTLEPGSHFEALLAAGNSLYWLNFSQLLRSGPDAKNLTQVAGCGGRFAAVSSKLVILSSDYSSGNATYVVHTVDI